jgi:hypothetical protein
MWIGFLFLVTSSSLPPRKIPGTHFC